MCLCKCQTKILWLDWWIRKWVPAKDKMPNNHQSPSLTLNFPVAVVNTLNTKTHSSKEMVEFPFKNADVKSICYCKQRMKSKLSLSLECVKTKLYNLCTSFTLHLHSSCGMVWYRTLRVKVNVGGGGGGSIYNVLSSTLPCPPPKLLPPLHPTSLPPLPPLHTSVELNIVAV